MERVKEFDGTVSIDGWEDLAKLFKGTQYLTPSIESDYLWLDEDSEEMGIEAAEEKMHQAKDNKSRNAWRYIRNNLRRMAGHRKGLGINGLTWEIS